MEKIDKTIEHSVWREKVTFIAILGRS